MSYLSREVVANLDQFGWPEACVIDIIQDQYIGLLDRDTLLTISRLHARLLKSLFENEVKKAELYRKQLLAACAEHDISRDQISEIDRHAFWEITALIQTSLRRTSRATMPVGAGLHAAVCRIGALSAGA